MKIVIPELIWPIGIEILKQKQHEVIYDPELWQDRNKLAAHLSDAKAIIVRNQTNVDESLLASAHQLKVVGRLGVGLNNIDLVYMKQRNIPVIFAKNANATSVAEYVMSAVFISLRQLTQAAHDVKQGNWNRKKYTGQEGYGKTLGLIGIGDIGHRTAVRAKAMGLQVLGYDPYVSAFDFSVVESGIQLASLEEVLTTSDFVSLHVPLTDETRNLIDRDALTKMKDTSYLINTSRGGIVNESDLMEALKQREISGAYLDVLEQEPPNPDHPLLALDGCIITPHIAGLTEESQLRTSKMVAEEVLGEVEDQVSMCRVRQ